MDKNQLIKNIEEMELKLAEMKKELAKAEKPFPQIGDTYYFIDKLGILNYQVAQDNNGRFQVFKTKDEAINFYNVECARQRVRDEIKRLNNGWTPDWTNYDESKFFTLLIENKLVIQIYKYNKVLDNSMFLKDYASALKIIDSNKDDLLLILGQ